MITALALGIVAGFVLSIAPGPIAIAAIKNVLHGQNRAGLLIAVGAAVMDMIFAMMAAFASSAIVLTLVDFVQGHAWLRLLLQVACIAILVFMGLRYLKSGTASIADSSTKEKEQEQRAKKLGLSSPFFIGVLLALMNLATPTFLPSLIGVMSYLRTNPFTSRFAGLGFWDNVMIAVGFGMGAFLWFLLIMQLLLKYRSRLPANFITHIYRFAGYAFLFFAVLLVYNVLTSVNWSAL